MTPSSQPLLFVSGYAPAGQVSLQACRFDPDTGALTAIASFSGITNPGFVAAHPNGRWLYIASEMNRTENGPHGVVWALRYDANAEPFKFEALNHQTSRGDAACHVRLDATGHWVLVPNY